MITITLPKWFVIAASLYLIVIMYPSFFTGLRMFIDDLRKLL